MTPDQGMDRIKFHAQPVSDSFLHMLRPYRGLRDDVLNDVMASLRACASKLSDEYAPRELMSALWAISHLGRSWALDPGGMLRRNRLINDADQARLADFLQRFDYAVMMLLEGSPEREAFGTESATRE